MSVFDLLDISLVHGWIVDPQVCKLPLPAFPPSLPPSVLYSHLLPPVLHPSCTPSYTSSCAPSLPLSLTLRSSQDKQTFEVLRAASYNQA